MKSPNEVKQEILEEWDKRVPYPDAMARASREYLSQSLDRLQTSIVERVDNMDYEDVEGQAWVRKLEVEELLK